MVDRLVELSTSANAKPRLLWAVGVVGLDFQGLPVMGDGLVDPSAAGQEMAEVVVGHRILRGAGQRVSPQCLAVAPVPRLPPGTSHQPRHRSAPRRPRIPNDDGANCRPHACAPGNRHVEPDLRQIRVAVGHRLAPTCTNPITGTSVPRIPKPPEEQVRALPPDDEDGRGNRQQHGDRCNHFPDRRLALGKRIEDCQIGRVKHFPEVGDVSHRGVGQSPRKGQVVPRDGWRRAGRQALPRTKPQPEQTRGFSRRANLVGWVEALRNHRFSHALIDDGGLRKASIHPASQSPERPIVQQEKHKRQRHQHRLGRQPQGKRGHHQQVPAPRCRALGVAGVEPKGQHEEQPAQYVLALGHPGDRFDPQRMNREIPPPPRHWARAHPSSAAMPGTEESPWLRARSTLVR